MTSSMSSHIMTSLFLVILLYNVPVLFASLEDGDAGKPLFLTPYIQRGRLQQARSLSRVRNLPDAPSPRLSYSGFITVDKEFNSNLFFWFVPAKVNPRTTPVILFLNGGPGMTSFFGMFEENGPYETTNDLKLESREYDWSAQYSMLYVDQPVGTGFSFTDDNRGYSRNQEDVARNMYSFLLQFFTLFRDFHKQDFYLSGQSYAGKYIPAISWKIHTKNPTTQFKINLRGFFISGPFTDPETVFKSSVDFMYNTGLLDRKQYKDFQVKVDELVELARRNASSDLPFDLYFGRGSYVYNASGYRAINSLDSVQIKPDVFNFMDYLNKPEVRRAIHAGSKVESFDKLFESIKPDILVSAKRYLVDILNTKQYKILLYSGQYDIVVCAPSTEALIYSMDSWVKLQEYEDANRQVWRLTDGDVAGYVTSVNGFKYVMVRGAGHNVPHDQPKRVMDMVLHFIQDVPFNKTLS